VASIADRPAAAGVEPGTRSRLPLAEGVDGAVNSDHAAHDVDQFIVREIVDLAMPGSLPASGPISVRSASGAGQQPSCNCTTNQVAYTPLTPELYETLCIHCHGSVDAARAHHRH
jgi:hypothetical protein